MGSPYVPIANISLSDTFHCPSYAHSSRRIVIIIISWDLILLPPNEVKKPSVPGSNKRDDTDFTAPNKLTQTLPAPPFSMLNVLGTKLVWFVWEISFKCCAGPH